MKQLRLFLVAAIMAVLSGCPVSPATPDTGMINPGDSGPDSDGNVDLDGGMPDSEVLPDSGTDTGTDAGPMPSVCDDPEYVGNECSLPAGMVYSRDAFLCATAINNDMWTAEGGTFPDGVATHEAAGVLLANLSFALANGGMTLPGGLPREFICGPEGACWLNWANTSSNYSHCRVSFSTDCADATVVCWPPGVGTTSVVTHGYYAGPA